jgi:hypothetical protein
MIRAIVATLLLLALGSAAEAQSGPADNSLYGTPAEARWAPFFAVLPACNDNGVLGTISDRFSQADTIFWGERRAIAGYERVREIGFRANGLSYIPRRYCVARAMMAEPPQTAVEEKRARTVIYSVVANDGPIGWGWGVQWCVVGLDRNHAYAPDCEVLKPILERWIGEYRPLASIYGLKARY